MTYTLVLLREADGRYSAIIPALDVGSWGHSVPEALRMVEEAFHLYVDAVQDGGGTIPPDPPEVGFELGDATEALVYKVDFTDSAPEETHIVMRHPDTGRMAIIPVHSEEESLPPGALGALIRQAGVTVEEFIELLEE
ncbi:MAG: hypothetical protein FJX75_24135 [Armatimonadetes bacterium]|nr:hypothetical protein [Armatimonadota bacterium]